VTKDASVKTIPWEKIVVEVEEISGIPRKQIDDTADQIARGMESVIEKNQPKRDGEEVVLETPFGGYTLHRLPAQNVPTENGKQVVRPTCIGLNCIIPRNFITKANVGLVDKATAESEKEKDKKKKSA
jgi:hypothetical protein